MAMMDIIHIQISGADVTDADVQKTARWWIYGINVHDDEHEEHE